MALGRMMLKKVKIYLEDTVVHSQDLQEHLEILAGVLEALRECGITINVKKCEWLTR